MCLCKKVPKEYILNWASYDVEIGPQARWMSHTCYRNRFALRQLVFCHDGVIRALYISQSIEINVKSESFPFEPVQADWHLYVYRYSILV